MLEKAESSLGRNLSNEDFKEILDEVRATFLAARDRAAASEAQAPTMMSETDVMDPEIQELLDQGYTEEQIQELINA
jgi:alkylhydroperoxidase family enzyme